MARCTTRSAATSRQPNTKVASENTKAAPKAKPPAKATSEKKVNSAANVIKAFENGSKEITLEFLAAGR